MKSTDLQLDEDQVASDRALQPHQVESTLQAASCEMGEASAVPRESISLVYQSKSISGALPLFGSQNPFSVFFIFVFY